MTRTEIVARKPASAAWRWGNRARAGKMLRLGHELVERWPTGIRPHTVEKESPGLMKHVGFVV